jgi:2-iminobutanoate/2-iminopropanoate deaminase
MVSKTKKYPMTYGGVQQTYPNIAPGMSFSSRSAIVGNLIFLNSFDGRAIETGNAASDSFEDQLWTCLDNIRFALEEAGSSMENLVKNLVLLRNIEDVPRMWKTMLGYYKKYAPGLVDEPPAITVTQVNALAIPACLVEIDAIGVVSKDAPGWEMRRIPMVHGGVKQVHPHVGPEGPFLSESVSVGNLVFISAMNGEDPESGRIETVAFEEQWHIGWDKARKALDNQGSSVSNVIKTLHFQTRLDAILAAGRDAQRSYSPASDRLWKAELEYYERYAPYLLDDFPASSFLKVPSLAKPGYLGQVDVIGVLSRFMPGWEVRKYPLYLAKRGFPRHIGDIQKYYANAVKVGNLVFLSGQTATDLKTARIETDVFEEQLAITLDHVRVSLEETGTALENVVKTHIFLPNPEHLTTLRKMELEYYQKYAPSLVDEPPATTVIHPLNLASPSLLIEMEAIAFVPD